MSNAEIRAAFRQYADAWEMNTSAPWFTARGIAADIREWAGLEHLDEEVVA